MSEFEGKTLLFTGHNGLTATCINDAKKIGIRTIAANFIPAEKAPAKQVADISLDVDCSDYCLVDDLIHKYHVDGVFTGFADSHLPIYRNICEKSNLHCYCTKEQIDITTNKLLFKELCRRNGVPTVKEYCISPKPTLEQLAQLEYPVMVKPADSSGSRGCRVCNNEKELLEAVNSALSFSTVKKVIVEKYMDRKNCDDVGIIYLFDQGKIYPVCIADRYTNMEQTDYAPLTSALVMPSKHLKVFERELAAPLEKMFKSIGIEYGTAFVQTFFDKEGFHVYEMGYRLGGGEECVAIKEDTGIDSRRALFRFAIFGKELTGEPLEKRTLRFENCYCNLHFLCSGGQISRIEGLFELENDPAVIEITQCRFIGDQVKADGTLAQVAFRVFIKAEDQTSLFKKINEIRTKIKIFDENDVPMLLHVFTPEDIGTGKC